MNVKSGSKKKLSNKIARIRETTEIKMKTKTWKQTVMSSKGMKWAMDEISAQTRLCYVEYI